MGDGGLRLASGAVGIEANLIIHSFHFASAEGRGAACSVQRATCSVQRARSARVIQSSAIIIHDA